MPHFADDWPTVRQEGAGALDAWLVPRRQMRFRPAPAPIRTPRAKLGGQPVWLASPTWPLSQCLGTPMMFVGQFPVPGEPMRLAYLFVTDDPDCTAATFDAEAGENALLVQPGGRIPPFVATTTRATGPSLWRRGETWDDHVTVELAVDLAPLDPAADAVLEARIARQQAGRESAPVDLVPDVPEGPIPPYSYVGGRVHV